MTAYDKSGTITSGAAGASRLVDGNLFVEPERDVESGELAARRFDACDWTYLRT
jgi:hypothetical protein